MKQKKLLNSLEDKIIISDHFTVDRLTEGWDVLNLFWYLWDFTVDKTQEEAQKNSETTTKEKTTYRKRC